MQRGIVVARDDGSALAHGFGQPGALSERGTVYRHARSPHATKRKMLRGRPFVGQMRLRLPMPCGQSQREGGTACGGSIASGCRFADAACPPHQGTAVVREGPG